MIDLMVDVECEAELLLRDMTSPVPGARALVAKHLGPDAIVVADTKGRDAFLYKHEGRDRIRLRPKLPRTVLRWALLHELAEWHLNRLDYREEDREAVAEALTAALVTPRRPLARAFNRDGRDLPKLAESFDTTQTSLALRLAEARCIEAAAVVRPGLVRVRAPDGFVMPSERELVRQAAGAPTPLERHVLTDGRRRTALLVA